MYEGDFYHGKKNGMGRYKLINGDSYTGEFKNDKYHGKVKKGETLSMNCY